MCVRTMLRTARPSACSMCLECCTHDITRPRPSLPHPTGIIVTAAILSCQQHSGWRCSSMGQQQQAKQDEVSALLQAAAHTAARAMPTST